MDAFKIYYFDRFNNEKVIVVCAESCEKAMADAREAIYGNVYAAGLVGKVS